MENNGMTTEKPKMEILQGRKYRGFGFINEYGEWTFRPCVPGDNPSGLKLVCEVNNVSLYESKGLYKIIVKMTKREYVTPLERLLFSDEEEREERIGEIFDNIKYMMDEYVFNENRSNETDGDTELA